MIIDQMHAVVTDYELTHRRVPSAIVLPPSLFAAARDQRPFPAVTGFSAYAEPDQPYRFLAIPVRCDERITCIEVRP